MYDARQIANWFINKSAGALDTLTLSQLFKLIYIAHERHIEKTGLPLVNNRIEAWKHGPVIPDVYQAFKDQGVYVETTDPHYLSTVRGADEAFLDGVYGEFGQLSVPALSRVTNRPNTPWFFCDQAVRAVCAYDLRLHRGNQKGNPYGPPRIASFID